MVAGLETFAKVRALHDRTDSAGEKAAAASRMKALARAAGMTVKQALSKLDASEPTIVASATFDTAAGFSSAFSDFFNTPEFRAERAEREAKRLAKCRELLERYGTEDAVFADTEREAALRLACGPLIVWDTRPDWQGHYAFAGWTDLGGKDSMPPAVREAVMSGWPRPETVAAAWSEFEAAEALDSDRYTFEPAYSPHRWVEARRYVLEDLLDTHPAKSLNDLRARLSWMEHLSSLECQWTHDNDAVRLATIRADIERMGQRIREENGSDPSQLDTVQTGQDEDAVRTSPTVQSGHPRRTNADKRRDVLALVGQGLPDREIARRAGVSPQTVGNIRRRN